MAYSLQLLSNHQSQGHMATHEINYVQLYCTIGQINTLDIVDLAGRHIYMYM